MAPKRILPAGGGCHVPCLLHMEIFVSHSGLWAGRKRGSSRTFCQFLPSGQEPKLQVLGPGGFHMLKSKTSANSQREKKIPHYQKEALVYSWSQGET